MGSTDGRFYVLDLATGAKLWEFHAGAPLSASPPIAAGCVVIGSQDGRLYQAPGSNWGQPGACVVIGSQDGRLYCFG